VADLRRIVITRADGGRRVRVDLTGAARTGEVSENLILEPGDLITVPEGIPAAVLVLGEVARPGSYDLQGQTRLLDALSRAGGPTPKADLHRLALTRAGQADTQMFDLQELLTRGEHGDATVDVLLRAGDTLVLPASEQKYYVLGAVARADAYPWKSTDHLLDAIAAAGGFSREADLTKVTLIRKDAAGQPVAKRMDLKRAMTSGKMPGDETLRAGDVIFVADRKRGRPITDFLRFLLPFSGVLGILR
jgi:polysaccharide export outer membrane protein